MGSDRVGRVQRLLYPPNIYTWIPASAVMTEEVQEKSPAEGLGVSPGIFLPPKIGGSRGLMNPIHPHIY